MRNNRENKELKGGSNPFKNKTGSQYSKDQQTIKKLEKDKKVRTEKIKAKKKQKLNEPKKVQLPRKVAKQLDQSTIKNSYGEAIIADWLKKHNFEFTMEKSFTDLRCPYTGFHLRYDFFLPKLKICIEFDGKQHFEYTEQFDKGDRALLKKRQDRDRLKDRFCLHRKFKMIRIKYTKINNIATILTQNLVMPKQ